MSMCMRSVCFLLVEAFSVDYSAMNDGKRKRNARGCFMSDRY